MVVNKVIKTLVIILIILICILVVLYLVKGAMSLFDSNGFVADNNTEDNSNKDVANNDYSDNGSFLDDLFSSSGKVELKAQTIGSVSVNLPNANLGWVNDNIFALEAAGQIWVYNNGNLKNMTIGTGVKRGFGGNAYDGGNNPEFDPVTKRIIYIAYKSGGGFYNASKIPYTYVLESVSIDQLDNEWFLSIEVPEEVYGFYISPLGNHIIFWDGSFIPYFEAQKSYKPEMYETLPYSGQFTQDESAIVFMDYDKKLLQKYDITNKTLGTLLDAKDCYRWGYCAKENLFVCSDDGESPTRNVYLFDLDKKTKEKLGSDIITSPFSFSPSCGKAMYRTYTHSEGVSLKYFEVDLQ